MLSRLVLSVLGIVATAPIVWAGQGSAPETIDHVLARAQNNGSVKNNFANSAGYDVVSSIRHLASASTQNSFNGSEGASEQGQNAGANSLIQNSLSLAAVQFCSACFSSADWGHEITVAASENTARVATNLDYPGYGPNSPGSGTPPSGGGGNTGSGGGNTPGSHGLAPQGNDPFGVFDMSYNGSRGVFSAAQNVGDNSILQNAITIASMRVNLPQHERVTIGRATNDGRVERNSAYSFDTPTATYTVASANGSAGIISLSQNAASNSLLQNSVAVSTLSDAAGDGDTRAVILAAASNTGRVSRNFSQAEYQGNDDLISGSFDGSVGGLISLQNAGANSNLQNVTSVGAFP